MPRNNRELLLSLLAAGAITAVYALVLALTREVPAAGELFGHSLGIIGFLLMLMTETLYSLRKRSRSAKWGRMAVWLQFHIFTGLVGPYMVLLHTSWKFNGLAGAVTVLTGIVVLSGFVGRYIYTAVPRTVDGVELEGAELARQIAAMDENIRARTDRSPQLAAAVQSSLASLPDVSRSGWAGVLGRALLEWDLRRQWRRAERRADARLRDELRQMEALVQKRQALRRQVASLALARRMLAVWHAVHIPIGMALFTAAFVHIGAALYYATFFH